MAQSLTGNEPDRLALGDGGEWVMTLQVRLYLLGFYRDWPDGTYDMRTESAVRELQSARGLDNDGEATLACWEAILYFEQQAAIDYYWQSPYDALAQIRYDLEHPSADNGAVSEDGQWRWTGSDWVAVGDGAAGGAGGDGAVGGAGGDGAAVDAGGDGAAASGAGASGAAPQLSDDGQWQWDGTRWQPADPAAAGGGAAGGQGGGLGGFGAGQLSEDGQWRWDGSSWTEASQGDDHAGQLSDDGQWRWNGREWLAA